MRYRTKSADVLNEADRYERILDWQLFCMEQERQLFGYNEEIEWVPGDPVYPHPDTVAARRASGWLRCSCVACVDPNEVLEGYYGNWIRPMIQTYELVSDGDLEEWEEDRYELVKRYPFVRCNTCGVSWEDNQPCWICGQFDEPIGPLREPQGFRGLRDILNLPPITFRTDTSEFVTAARQMSDRFGEFSLELQETRNLIYQAFRFNDASFSNQEWNASWEAANPDPWAGLRAVTPYFVTPELSVFEREVPERIVTASISESAAELLYEDPTAPSDAVWRRARRTRLRLPRQLSPEELGPQVPTFPLPVRKSEQDWNTLQNRVDSRRAYTSMIQPPRRPR